MRKGTVVTGLVALLASTPVSATTTPCVTPVDGMSITQDTTFCPGSYSVPNGISIDADGVTLECDGTELVGDYSSNPGQGPSGISVIGVDDVFIKGCTVDDFYRSIFIDQSDASRVRLNDLNPTEGNTALYLRDSTNSRITANTLRGTTYVPGDSYGNLIQNNEFLESPGAAVFLLNGSHHNMVRRNTFLGTTDGVDLQYGSHHNRVVDNDFLDIQRYGVVIVNATNSLVFHNTLDGVGSDAVRVAGEDTDGNMVVVNRIYDAGGDCISVQESSRNLFANNSLIGCANPVSDELSSFWNTRRRGGNHYEEYDQPSEGCHDTNLDGFCDAPYVIDADSQDNKPLVSPVF